MERTPTPLALCFSFHRASAPNQLSREMLCFHWSPRKGILNPHTYILQNRNVTLSTFATNSWCVVLYDARPWSLETEQERRPLTSQDQRGEENTFWTGITITHPKSTRKKTFPAAPSLWCIQVPSIHTPRWKKEGEERREEDTCCPAPAAMERWRGRGGGEEWTSGVSREWGPWVGGMKQINTGSGGVAWRADPCSAPRPWPARMGERWELSTLNWRLD